MSLSDVTQRVLYSNDTVRTVNPGDGRKVLGVNAGCLNLEGKMGNLSTKATE